MVTKMLSIIKFVFNSIIALLILAGCSGLNQPTQPASNLSEYNATVGNGPERITWQYALFQVSQDHSAIQEVPLRTSDWHINVNTFIEPPKCNHCMTIGQPQIQPDGSMKVSVMLSHPFPNQPEYTGFDVRGIVVFNATRYWKMEPFGVYSGNEEFYYDGYLPLYFSLGEDGGAELLNADGYTLYLNPGLDAYPHWPITKYSKGKHAYGPDPDSTINGYRVFTKDPERRMFLVTDTISRIYHIDPPDGEFYFGYVVDASWMPPSKMPVTDPAVDFPYWANMEDGYVTEFEQTATFYTGTYAQFSPGPEVDRDITRAVILHNMNFMPIDGGAIYTSLICPDLTEDPSLKYLGIALGNGSQGIDEYTKETIETVRFGTYEAPAGEYTALLVAKMQYDDPSSPYFQQIDNPLVFDFIKLHVETGNW